MNLFLFFLLYFFQFHAGVLDWFSTKQYAAVQAYHKHDYEQALVDLSEVMNKNPYDFQANYNIGNIFYKQKKYRDAKQSYLRVVEQKNAPGLLQAQAFFNAGNSSYQLEEWQEAVQAYQKVLELQPDNEHAQHNLQLALYKLKEQEMKDQAKQEQQKDKQQKLHQQAKTDQNQDQSMDNKNQSQDDNADGNSQDNDGANGSSQGQQSQDEQQSDEQQSKDNKKENTGNKDCQKNKQQGKHNLDEEQKNEQGIEQQQGSGGEKNIRDQHGPEQANSEKIEDQKQQLHDMQERIEDRLQQQKSQQQNDGQQGLDDDQQGQGDSQNYEHAEEQAKAHVGEEKFGEEKEEMHGVYKKPELQNQLQQEYESKASDDERLTEYHALVMKTLEELEEKIQKHVIKNKVAMQGAGQNGKKGW